MENKAKKSEAEASDKQQVFQNQSTSSIMRKMHEYLNADRSGKFTFFTKNRKQITLDLEIREQETKKEKDGTMWLRIQ